MPETSTTKSEAETVMSAAGFTRVGGAGLQAWAIDHDNGEFSLVTADGDADADPKEVLWTVRRFTGRDSHVVWPAAIQSTIGEPLHRNLAQTVAAVPSLTVPEPVAAEVEPVAKAVDQPTRATRAEDGNGAEHQG